MAVTQSHYRFGKDDGTEATHTWWANEDADPAQGDIAVDTPFLLRFTLQCDGTAQSNVDAEFQYRLNGGTWTQITTTSSVVKAVPVDAFTNGQNTTKRLSGTGTFESSSAGCTEDGISGGNAFDIVANGNGETECGLQIVGTDVVNDDVIEFRLTRDGGTLLNTYAVTPTLTVAVAAQQFFQTIPATAVGVAALTRLLDLSQAVAATAVGVAGMTASKLFMQAVGAVAVGVADIVTAVTRQYQQAIGAVAVGVAAMSSRLTLSQVVTASALGVASVVGMIVFGQVVSAVALAVAGIATLFTPGDGGGGGGEQEVYHRSRRRRP